MSMGGVEVLSILGLKINRRSCKWWGSAKKSIRGLESRAAGHSRSSTPNSFSCIACR